MFKSSYDNSSSTYLPFIDFYGGLLYPGDLPFIDHMNTSISIPDGASSGMKVERYSAEDRRERIERYRIKRNQRNFRKKITYACRKTLADSRPRVRGRFAKNDEAELETESPESGEVGGDWWSQMKSACEEYDFDEFSMNLSNTPLL